MLSNDKFLCSICPNWVIDTSYSGNSLDLHKVIFIHFYHEEDIVMSNFVNVKVEGMTCGGCASKVANNIKNINGVREVNVDLSSGNVEIEFSEIDLKQVESKIEELGYNIV